MQLLAVFSFLAATLIGAVVSTSPAWIRTLGSDVDNYLDHGEISENLKLALDMLRFRTPYKTLTPLYSNDVKLLDVVTNPNDRSEVSCAICREAVEMGFGWIESGLSKEEIIDRAVAICVSLQISTPEVCRGNVENNVDTVLWIITTRNSTSSPLVSRVVCGFLLYPDSETLCNLADSEFNWEISLSFLPDKPPVEIPAVPPEDTPTFQILQFTDIHIDLEYKPGGNAVCDEPLCCRNGQGEPANPEDAAGYYGDYRPCDMPMHAVTDLLQDAAKRFPDISYIIYSGDIVDHASFQTSREHNTQLLQLILDEIAKHFPKATITPVFGNHDAHPSDYFADPTLKEIPSEIATDWLYQYAADAWTAWLPEATRDTIAGGGMYQFELMPGLVVIGLNNIFCYTANWWLLYKSSDPASELVWLATVLGEVEATNKKAHIITHIPTGLNDCMHMWSAQYRKIIDRFENVVVGHFHGHTHNDEYTIFYSLVDPSRANNVAFTGGSATTFIAVNPNYRVYTADATTFRLLDHETWFYNLTEANLGGPDVPPRWQKMYSFNEAYGTKVLFPSELDGLAHRMALSEDLQNLYYRNLVRDADASMASGCDSACLKGLMCQSVTSVNNDTAKCQEIFP